MVTHAQARALIQQWWTVPMKILTAFTAIGSALAFFGFMVVSPKQQLETHIVQSTAIHDTLTKTVERIDRRQEKYEVLVTALIRGECLKNSRENLARQGLIKQCQQEGIIR